MSDRPSSPPLVPVPPVPVNTPFSTPEFSPPKLMPTPVSEPLPLDSGSAPITANPVQLESSEQLNEPKLTETPEAPQEFSDAQSIPDIGPLPSEGKRLPPPLPEPLPDILVDPFIDDVGQATKRSGISLTGGTLPAPSNALRGTEPKRLKSSNIGTSSSHSHVTKPTRIVIKRSVEQKISQ